jgi:hypothetical protein
MKAPLTLLLLLLATPALADDGGIVGAIVGALAYGMSNNNQGDPGYSGASNDDNDD